MTRFESTPLEADAFNLLSSFWIPQRWAVTVHSGLQDRRGWVKHQVKTMDQAGREECVCAEPWNKCRRKTVDEWCLPTRPNIGPTSAQAMTSHNQMLQHSEQGDI